MTIRGSAMLVLALAAVLLQGESMRRDLRGICFPWLLCLLSAPTNVQEAFPTQKLSSPARTSFFRHCRRLTLFADRRPSAAGALAQRSWRTCFMPNCKRCDRQTGCGEW